MFRTFRLDILDVVYSVDTDRDGWVQINYEQFMQVSWTGSALALCLTHSSFAVDGSQCPLILVFYIVSIPGCESPLLLRLSDVSAMTVTTIISYAITPDSNYIPSRLCPRGAVYADVSEKLYHTTTI